MLLNCTKHITTFFVKACSNLHHCHQILSTLFISTIIIIMIIIISSIDNIIVPIIIIIFNINNTLLF